MKYFIKGIGLGLSLNIAQLLCDNVSYGSRAITSVILFFIITNIFLISDTIPNLLLCGFTGLFVMFFSEIFIFAPITDIFDIDVYLYGMFGSIAAIATACLITTKKIKLPKLTSKQDDETDITTKTKLIVYTLITAISFSYLILPEYAGISVPIFTAIQFICLWFIVSDRKKLILFIPIFIMSLNSFISANTTLRTTNFLLSIVLYCCMFINFKIKNDSCEFILNIISYIISAFSHIPLPFKWIAETSTQKAPILKRLVAALVVALPCTILLIATLANADMVFSIKTENLLTDFFDFFNANVFFKIIYGIITGLFAFGVLYNAHTEELDDSGISHCKKGDLIIINTLLLSVLLVYTLFVIIQFKYLFAGTKLPAGLTYTEYARKGFFELLALTGVNILGILIITRLTKSHSGKWLTFTKCLCHYLCAVTVILLISSFYRMLLYTNDDGLTRLRFYVMGFLIFECIGLIITFIYIAKPKFNIVLIYFIIAITYYTIMNIVPTDNIIAQNQINKYLKGEREDIEYIYSLSADAAPAIKHLIENANNVHDIQNAKNFLLYETYFNIPQRWQRFNFATNTATKVLNMTD